MFSNQDSDYTNAQKKKSLKNNFQHSLDSFCK